MLGIYGIVLWNFIARGDTKHGIGYFLFFWIAVVCIHFFTEKFPPKNEIQVKAPKRELIVALLFSAIGAVLIGLNFYFKSHPIEIGLVKIPFILGMFLFTFPLGLAIYLLIKKYKILDLGIRTNPILYVFLGLLVWGLTGLFAYLFNPQGIIWKEGLQEMGGILGLIINGLIAAALAEEFTRFIIQSRFEKVIKVEGLNILFATIIWAFMHFPMAYFQSNDTISTTIYCIQIIPLGFVWGYLTHRTKSIVPAILAHGFNLWGLQNS